MSDKYFQESRTTSLYFWALGQMMKGAGLALLFCLALAILWFAMLGISWMLPEQSKQMPSPFGQIEAPLVPEATDLA